MIGEPLPQGDAGTAIDDPAFPRGQQGHALERAIAEITGPQHLNTRRERTYPRAVKRARRNSYPVRKPGQHGTPATIKLVNPVFTRAEAGIAA